VSPGRQISSRVIESALHSICSELLEVSISSLENIDNNETGFNVQFSRGNDMETVIRNLLLSPTYNLKGGVINFVNDDVLKHVMKKLANL
jgi:hypothetical protein